MINNLDKLILVADNSGSGNQGSNTGESTSGSTDNEKPRNGTEENSSTILATPLTPATPINPITPTLNSGYINATGPFGTTEKMIKGLTSDIEANTSNYFKNGNDLKKYSPKYQVSASFSTSTITWEGDRSWNGNVSYEQWKIESWVKTNSVIYTGPVISILFGQNVKTDVFSPSNLKSMFIKSGLIQGTYLFSFKIKTFIGSAIDGEYLHIAISRSGGDVGGETYFDFKVPLTSIRLATKATIKVTGEKITGQTTFSTDLMWYKLQA